MMTEKEIEEKLIRELNVKDQWVYRPDLKTVEDLRGNLRKILNSNNVEQLDGKPLSDKEFEQIRNELTFSTNFEAAKRLIGQNGVAHVSFKRDGKKISLNLFFRNQRFGNNVYEVVNQVTIPKTVGMDKERRFDVTLLINGLPLIQIELKKQSVSEKDAFEQIKKYEIEGAYKDIFRFVQLFVISNYSVTRYFAAGTEEELKKSHLSTWRDSENNVVSNLDSFTDLVLKRPMAYDMITKYTVLEEDKNNSRKRIIVLRPYQIQAIQAVEEASKRSFSGYVWHTTGSGKTLTSYKCTRNLVNDIPSIEKSIFLIDRKDLDTQTSSAFLSYSENDLVDVDTTTSTRELREKLMNNVEQVIVASIQKLNILIKELNKEYELGEEKAYENIKNKRVAFVVDECHRTISPERMIEVRKFFQRSLWYGFTGTPRFEENAYQNNGYARTTDELYGKLNGKSYGDCCLHKYTIENAIKDESVLGFKIKYMTSSDDDKDDEKNHLTETHMLNVIKNIIQTWNIWGKDNGAGNTFESLLTVPNIKIAQIYYELFKKVLNGEYTDKGIVVSNKIKEVLPDFSKIAISYSVQDDNDNMDRFEYNQQKMQEAIDDYNEMFDTHFKINEIDSYNQDLQNRLKRVGKKYVFRNSQLDLVIVVNRLLTGFDANYLANVFVDRQPMELHTIIQMFSRTNRIAPKLKKEYGNIITFQSPEKWQSKVKEAVKLFTNGGEKYALAREYSEVKKDYLKRYKKIKTLQLRYPNFDDIETATVEEKKEFLSDFQSYEKVRREIQTYVDYINEKKKEKSENDVSNSKESDNDMYLVAEDIIPELEEDVYNNMCGHYNSIRKEFKNDAPLEIENGYNDGYDFIVADVDKINIEYITALLDSFKDNPNKKLEDDIVKYISKVEVYNPKLAEILFGYFKTVKSEPSKYKGRTSIDVINEIKTNIIKTKCSELAEEYSLNFDNLYYSASRYNIKVENAEDINEIQNIIVNAKVPNKKPFEARRIVKDKIKELFDNEILPLNKTE